MPGNAAILTEFLRAVATTTVSPSMSDGELVELFVRDNREEAISELVRRHRATVWSVCRRILGQQADVEDAVQATFLLLLRRARDLAKPELVGSWLYSVARKVALRARQQRSSESRKTPVQSPAAAADPLDVLSGGEVLQILDEELLRMPEEYRAPLILCCLEGKTREEAARQLGWSEGSIKGRLERGRELLAIRLTRRGVTLTAALGMVLVWKTTGVCAAATSVVCHFAAAKPQVLALVNTLEATLGTWFAWKWYVVAAMLFVGVGYGGAVAWTSLGTNHQEPSQQVRAAHPVPDSAVTNEREPENAKPEAPKVVTEQIPGDILSVNDVQLTLLPTTGDGDDREENEQKAPPRCFTLSSDTRILWRGKLATTADLRKGIRVTVTIRGTGDTAVVESIEGNPLKRDRGKPENIEENRPVRRDD